MNIVEKYVYNITSVKETKYKDILVYELECDTDCCGDIRNQVTISLTAEQYKMVKEKRILYVLKKYINILQFTSNKT